MQKIKRFFESDILSYINLFLILGSGILFLFSFSMGINQYDLHDYIEGVFWADASLKSFSFVNPDYVYYYLIPFGSNIIMAPFVALFGTSLLANQLGMVVFYLLYIFVAFKLANALFPDNKRSMLLFVCVVSLFVYTYVGDNLLHHLLMYGIGFVCLLGELACLIEINNQKNTKTNYLLLLFFCLWSSLNGFSAALSTIPVIVALVYTKYKRNNLFDNESIRLIFSMFAISVFGLLTFYFCNSIAITGNMYDTRLRLTDFDSLVNNIIHNIFANYLKFFYYTPDKTPIFSKQGFLFLTKLMFALTMVILPIILYKKRSSKENNEIEDLLFISSVLIMFVSISQFLLTALGQGRYLFNAILSVFVLCAYFCAKDNKFNNIVYNILVFALVICLSTELIVYTLPQRNKDLSEIEEVYGYIENDNLTYGYSFVRNWKIIDVVSKGECYNVVVGYDSKAKGLYVNKDRIYLQDLNKPSNINSFYIIAKQEQVDKYSEVFSDYKSLNKVGDYSIYVYDIKDWDKMFIVKDD